jgi:hypothetical protein
MTARAVRQDTEHHGTGHQGTGHPDTGHQDTGHQDTGHQDTVRQVTVPATARAQSTLDHIDYDDAFLVETGWAPDRTAEQWARAIVEKAPEKTRNALLRGWGALGLRLDATGSDEFVLGWEVRRSTPDFALLGARGRRGLSGELLFERQPGTLLFATFVQLENRAARGLWAVIEARHVQVVRNLLERASGPEQP